MTIMSGSCSGPPCGQEMRPQDASKQQQRRADGESVFEVRLFVAKLAQFCPLSIFAGLD